MWVNLAYSVSLAWMRCRRVYNDSKCIFNYHSVTWKWKEFALKLAFQDNRGKCSRIVLFALPIIACVLLLTACGGTQAIRTSEGKKVSASSMIMNASAILKHSPSGLAKLVWQPKLHPLSVEIPMSGLVPASIHPAHIHASTCKAAGKVVYGLHNVVADAMGMATVTTIIPNVTD